MLYLDLAKYVSISELLEMKPLLDYAIVKSSTKITPAKYTTEQFYDQTYTGISNMLMEYSDPKLDKFSFIQDLRDNDQLAAWVRYQHDVVYGQQSIPIIFSNNWDTKHIASECIPTENKKYFQILLDWLDKQNIFKEYGRVVAFTNEPGVVTPMHRDYPFDTSTHEFIWISLDDRKKFYVIDPSDNTKHYLNFNIGCFDITNYHGSDVSQFASYSIRIDGIFSDEFLDNTGLREFYRK